MVIARYWKLLMSHYQRVPELGRAGAKENGWLRLMGHVRTQERVTRVARKVREMRLQGLI
jgi:hypothetical protein